MCVHWRSFENVFKLQKTKQKHTACPMSHIYRCQPFHLWVYVFMLWGYQWRFSHAVISAFCKLSTQDSISHFVGVWKGENNCNGYCIIHQDIIELIFNWSFLICVHQSCDHWFELGIQEPTEPLKESLGRAFPTHGTWVEINSLRLRTFIDI